MATKRRKSIAMPKRRKRAESVVAQVSSRRVFERAQQAYFENHDANEARRLLEQLEAQGPLSHQATDLYLDVLHKQGDFNHYARIARLSAERNP